MVTTTSSRYYEKKFYEYALTSNYYISQADAYAKADTIAMAGSTDTVVTSVTVVGNPLTKIKWEEKT